MFWEGKGLDFLAELLNHTWEGKRIYFQVSEKNRETAKNTANHHQGVREGLSQMVKRDFQPRRGNIYVGQKINSKESILPSLLDEKSNPV